MGVIERPSQSKMSRNLSSFTSKVGKTKIFPSLFSQAQQTGQETFQWLTANSILREKNRSKHKHKQTQALVFSISSSYEAQSTEWKLANQVSLIYRNLFLNTHTPNYAPKNDDANSVEVSTTSITTTQPVLQKDCLIGHLFGHSRPLFHLCSVFTSMKIFLIWAELDLFSSFYLHNDLTI